MEGWEVELAVADHFSRLWEDLNDVTVDRMYEDTADEDECETLREAHQALGFAVESMDSALDSIQEAAEALEDTPDGDRIMSILNDLEGYLKQLEQKRDEYANEYARRAF